MSRKESSWKWSLSTKYFLLASSVNRRCGLRLFKIRKKLSIGKSLGHSMKPSSMYLKNHQMRSSTTGAEKCLGNIGCSLVSSR